MNVRLWPDEDIAVVCQTVGWPRSKFIRFVLQRMRSQEHFDFQSCRVFMVPNCGPPLNSFVISPAGFIYLPQEWANNLGELKNIRIPTITSNMAGRSKDLVKFQKYIPAWLAITMATEPEQAQRIKAFAGIAERWARTLGFTDEAAFSA
jgi:hypothetical protein